MVGVLQTAQVSGSPADEVDAELAHDRTGEPVQPFRTGAGRIRVAPMAQDVIERLGRCQAVHRLVPASKKQIPVSRCP